MSSAAAQYVVCFFVTKWKISKISFFGGKRVGVPPKTKTVENF